MPDMIEVKVAEAEGATLDFMAARATGVEGPITWEWNEHREDWLITYDNEVHSFCPSSDWTQGGPLIDRFEIELFISATAKGRFGAGIKGRCAVVSDSYLLSAMRVLVRAELGDTVAVPAELQRKEDNPT